MTAKHIMLLVLVVLFVILILQNTQAAETELFFLKASMSKVLLYALLVPLGAIAGWKGCFPDTGKRKQDL